MINTIFLRQCKLKATNANMQQKTCNRPNLYHLNNRSCWLIIVVGIIINMTCDNTLTAGCLFYYYSPSFSVLTTGAHCGDDWPLDLVQSQSMSRPTQLYQVIIFLMFQLLYFSSRVEIKSHQRSSLICNMRKCDGKSTSSVSFITYIEHYHTFSTSSYEHFIYLIQFWQYYCPL